uniref:Uncharacterized protein n=1 Tax=Rhipicephalus zambeziensis TaxID=60191 RepID=A0A224YFK6_9ACAR
MLRAFLHLYRLEFTAALAAYLQSYIVASMIMPMATPVSCAAVAANGSHVFNLCALSACTCLQNYVVAIYDRVYNGFDRSGCGKQHVGWVCTFSFIAAIRDHVNNDRGFVRGGCCKRCSSIFNPCALATHVPSELHHCYL